MAGIRGRDTRPELFLRRALHRHGFRYRLHVGDLPGRPDLVFPRWCAALFVHGCFWHGHGCPVFRWPKSNEAFWRQKIEANKVRDARQADALRAAGWRVGTVWECSLRREANRQAVVEACIAWLLSGAGDIDVPAGTQA
ncbi:MAG: very short patch repair endonuclease [Hyphomonas sp.]|nr:very short patch repair endonuclease [Hyphomonas sp.]